MIAHSSKGLDLVVLVSGRGSNLQAIIDAIASNQIKSRVKAVVSNKSDAYALERAKNAGIKTCIVSSKNKSRNIFNHELLSTISDLAPDLIVLAGFMRILPQEFINNFANRIINIHPSLLPSFPGLEAQAQAIAAGVKITGCTVHFVDEGCDTGPIIVQNSIEILNNDDPHSLSERLLPIEHASIVHAIKLLEDNKVVLQGKKTLLRNRP